MLRWFALGVFSILWMPAFLFSLLGLGFGGLGVLSWDGIVDHNGWAILAVFIINPITVAAIGYIFIAAFSAKTDLITSNEDGETDA